MESHLSEAVMTKHSSQIEILPSLTCFFGIWSCSHLIVLVLPLSVLFNGVAEWATVFRTDSTNGEFGRNILHNLRRFRALLWQQLHLSGFYFLSPGRTGFSLLYWTLWKEICICSLVGCRWFNKLKYTSKSWKSRKVTEPNAQRPSSHGCHQDQSCGWKEMAICG